MAIKYTVHPIEENTWAIEEKTPISQGLCYLLQGREKALLIDTGFGGKTLRPTVEGLTRLPVTVANTHAHLDHIGGNHFFGGAWYHEADKPIFALHTNLDYTYGLFAAEVPAPLRLVLGRPLKKILKIDPSGQYHYFTDGHVFDLGGRSIEVISTPGHTPGSVCFFDAANRQLFTGDTVCEWGILLGLKGEAAPPEAFLKAMQRLKAMEGEFDTIWPGHHGFPVEKSYIDDYLHCAESIVAGTPQLSRTKGRLCATYGRVLITLPEEAPTDG